MRAWTKLGLRFRSIFAWRKIEKELDNELEFHLQHQVAENLAGGMSPNEARSAALRSVGRPTEIKEQCREMRGLRLLGILRQDLRYTVRSLGRNPGFTAVAVLTMGLGIGATTAIFSMVNGVLLNPLPYPESDRLVAVWESAPERGRPNIGFSYLNYRDLAQQTRSFTRVGAWRYNEGVLETAAGDREFVRSRMISAGLASVLDIPLEAGRSFTPEEDRVGGAPVALVSDALANRLFGGSSAALGRGLTYRGVRYTVVGVLPAPFRVSPTGPMGTADIFTPLGQENEVAMQRRDFHPNLRVVGRLAPGVNLDSARVELSAIASRLKAAYPEAFMASSFDTRPMAQEIVGTELPRTLMLLLAAVAILLLIGFANVANLLVVRAVSRRNEFSIRAALGAGRRRLVGQCLTEGVCLTLAGGAVGLFLAQGATTALVAAWPGVLPRSEEIAMDWPVLAFAMAVSVVAGLAFGLIPARSPHHGDREGPGITSRAIVGRSRRTQSALVASEVALTLLLLAAAGTTVATALSLWSTDPGFESDGLLVATLLIPTADGDGPEDVWRRWEQAVETARSNPEVTAAALTSLVPLTNASNTLHYRATPAAIPVAEMPSALITAATPEYREIMSIPLIAGRFFSEFDGMDTEPVVVIDEVLAETAFPEGDPVGRQLWILGVPARIVGVVGHVRHFGLRADDRSSVRSQMYLPFRQIPEEILLGADTLSIVAATRSAPEATLGPLHDAIRARGAWGVADLRTMDSIVRDSSGPERFLLYLFNGFGFLALVLSTVGLYGVVAYMARQRTAEFGLRMALGADPGQIGRLVFGHAARIFLAGTAIGVVLIIALSRIWNSTVENAEPVGVSGILVALAVLAATVLLATWLPVRREARIDPMTALRYE